MDSPTSYLQIGFTFIPTDPGHEKPASAELLFIGIIIISAEVFHWNYPEVFRKRKNPGHTSSQGVHWPLARRYAE
jgi:hypothetical protein